MPAPSALNSRLGYDPGARLVILNADDFGMCRASTDAISSLLAAGHVSSATVMMPCGWAPDAVARAVANQAWDVGVHTVLTSEWTRYRWRPLTGARSLADDAGYFPPDCASVETRAAEADVAAELSAQLAAARALGLDVTHLDNHMGSVYGLQTGRHFLGQVLPLCAQEGLPFRLPRSIEGMGIDGSFQSVLDQVAQEADMAGVVGIDYLWSHPFELVGEGTGQAETYESVKAGFLGLLRALKPGVTEIFLHPMADTDELHAAVDFAATKRGWEYRLLADPEVAAVIGEEGIERIGWRDLRALQRAER